MCHFETQSRYNLFAAEIAQFLFRPKLKNSLCSAKIYHEIDDGEQCKSFVDIKRS